PSFIGETSVPPTTSEVSSTNAGAPPNISMPPVADAPPTLAMRAKRRLPALSLALIFFLLLLGGAAWLVFHGKVHIDRNGSPQASLLALFKHAELAEVKVFPTEVNLKNKQARQSLMVQATYADGATRDVTAETSYSLGNRSVVKMTQHVLSPLADGKTEMQVKYQGRTLTVPVSVQD